MGFTVDGIVDVDGVDEVFVAGETATVAGVGTLTIGADGVYSFTPVLNYIGPVPVATYTINDGQGTETSMLTIAVVEVTDEDETVSTNEDTPISGNVIDTSLAGETVTLTGFAVDTGNDGSDETFLAGETATIAGVGELTIGYDGAYTFTPIADYNGSVPVATYTLTYGEVIENSTLTITITGVNDAPVAMAVTSTVTEDAAGYEINFLTESSATDVDGDTVTFVANSVLQVGSTDAGGVAIDQARGVASVNPDHYDYLVTGESVEVTYTFNVTDGEATVQNTATITINGADDQSEITLAAGDAATGDVTEDVDTDTDTTNGVQLITSGHLTMTDADANGAFSTEVTSAAPTTGSLTIDAAGYWTYTGDNAEVQYLVAGETITEVFTVQTTDGTSQDITITINTTHCTGENFPSAYTPVSPLGAFFPSLADGQAIDPDLVNGIINDEYLQGDGNTDFVLNLQDTGYAWYQNVLGVYEITPDGSITDARIIIDNVNTDKTAAVLISDVESGNKLGFFVVQNAADWASGLTDADTFDFVGSDGWSQATVSDGAGIQLQVNGQTAWKTIFHSYAAEMNDDGIQHALSGIDTFGEIISVGFEDIVGGGDRDYEDVVFSIERVDADVFLM
jgi:VCBS repeat-containing protein